MLTRDKTALIVVDVQEKLARAMHERDGLVGNVVKLVKGAQVLGIPILVSEQYPQGLGSTLSEVQETLAGIEPISKLKFSCCREARFQEELEKLGLKTMVVAGIESHVCVYQTVMDLLELGYEVQVIEDAVSSRTPENKKIGLDRCKELGASVSSVETVLFELLEGADQAGFKEIQEIVK